MNETKLGKISNVRFGHGGYQDCCLGLSLTFEGKNWGVGTFIGAWDPESIPADKHTKWTEADRDAEMVKMLRKFSKLLKQAKVDNVNGLKNIPVEVEFEGQSLKEWRILEEVL